MKQQEVFKKIGGIITELNDQYEYLKTIDGPLNELELELFLANSNFLTDHLLILSKLNAQNLVQVIPATKDDLVPVIKSDVPVPSTNYFEPLVSAAKPEVKDTVGQNSFDIYKADGNKVENNPVPSIQLETKADIDPVSIIRQEEPETIRHELILDESGFDNEDEPYAAEEIEDGVDKNYEVEIPAVPPIPVAAQQQPKYEQQQPAIIKPEVQVAQEQAKPDVLTINERISAQMAAKQGVAQQLHAQNINDLKQAINLNDKLLFIKDLFNGYSLAYSEAIEILNRFADFTEAEQFLNKNYVAKNQWENKPETTEKFYALLKRRYA